MGPTSQPIMDNLRCYVVQVWIDLIQNPTHDVRLPNVQSPIWEIELLPYRRRFRNDLRVQARLFPGVIELHSGVTPGSGLPIRHTAEKPSKSIVRSTDESMCNSQSPRHAAPISGSDKSRQTFMLSQTQTLPQTLDWTGYVV